MNPESILAEFSQQQVLGFMLVLARVSPLFLLAPLFSSKMIPARARGIVAVALALGIAPIASATAATLLARAGIILLENIGASRNSGPMRPSTSRKLATCCSPNWAISWLGFTRPPATGSSRRAPASR